MITTIDLLRHGEVSGGQYYRGITDDPLTSLGWQQMHSAVVGCQWDHIITSPLRRCSDFARYCSEQKQISLSIDPGWQEINFGDWEGKTAQQINPKDLFCFYQDPLHYTPSKAEPYLVFQNRLNQAWHEIVQRHLGKHLLIVTHAGVIRCLFHLLLNLPLEKIFNLQIGYASYTYFQCISQPDENIFIQLVLPEPSLSGVE